MMALSDQVLEQLADMVETNSEQFARTFLRAQHDRDERRDLAVVVNADPGIDPIHACFRYARAEGFLKHLLRCCIDDQVAGPLSEPAGRTFADLCQLHADIQLPISADAFREAAADLDRDTVARERERAERQGFRPEAINEAGFDCNAKQHGEQVQSTIAMVCRIDDARGRMLGSGVLIAPHLVATAAHVVETHVNEAGEAQPEGARRIRVKLNAFTTSAVDESPENLDDDWLAGLAASDHRPDDKGRMTLPAAEDLTDSHDVAVLRLKGAPGWIRGWVDVTRARAPVDSSRRGLCFHHHPGGAAQVISMGSHLGAHGCRFLHNCSSIPGSSGGPLLDHDARLVGLHHGFLEDEPDQPALAGGGEWLADWWDRNPALRSTAPEKSPFWEIRTSGSPGTGEPVIGFDRMQERVWSAQRGESPLCAVATMSASAGRVLGGLVAKMLPSDRAEVVVLTRSELNRYAAIGIGGATPVTTVLQAMAGRLEAPPANADPILSGSEVATDSVVATQLANELAERLRRVQTSRTLWMIVNVGDGNLPSAVSEALGHLYRTVLGLSKGRGKLLVIGSDPLIRAPVAGLVEDIVAMTEWDFPKPDDAAIERYMHRWSLATAQSQVVRAGAVEFLPMFKQAADQAADREHGGDWYAALCATLRRDLTGRANP